VGLPKFLDCVPRLLVESIHLESILSVAMSAAAAAAHGNAMYHCCLNDAAAAAAVVETTPSSIDDTGCIN
jgi:hypothetical protein